jgi:hypothetical protein
MNVGAVIEQRQQPISVALAWRRYLVTVQTSEDAEYERVEERAWQRLTSELERLGAPMPEREHDA